MSGYIWNTGDPSKSGWYLVCHFDGEKHSRFSREFIEGYGWVNAKEEKYGKIIRWGVLPSAPALEDTDLNINIIVAMTKNGVIGWKGDMPWRCRNELRHFKERTFGKMVVAGRKTAESLPSLPYRQCFYLSRNPDAAKLENGFTPITYHEVLTRSVATEVMIIGGGEIYSMFMPLAKREVNLS